MSDLSERDSLERQWAQTRFRNYLLHRLTEEDEERILDAVVRLPGLADELEDAEERLIELWLDGRMAPDDHEEFQRYYVNGTETNRARLAVFQALRTAQSQRRDESPRRVKAPIPFPGRAQAGWAAGVVAAVLLACVLGMLLYREAGQNARLRTDLAKLRSNPLSGQQRQQTLPTEQQAGMSSQGGLNLAPGDSGKLLRIPSLPSRLIWNPVPDYRAQYRIRVSSSSGGQEQVSPLLTPRDNSVEYAPDQSSPMPLPWDIAVLTPDGGHEKVVARYTLAKQK
jgi:hypothetical protein